MAEKLLILGSNSFSGAHFAAHALTHGFEVVGISRSAEPDAVFLPYRWQSRPAFEFHQLDLNRDLDRIMAVIEGFKPEYIVNFAAQGMVAESWDRPEHWYRTNFLSATALHERLRNNSHLKCFMQISTPEVYGDCVDVVSEDAPLRPSTPYAVSKAACDMNLRIYHRQYGFPAITTRAANVYGPGQPLYRIIPRTILAIKKGVPISLHGGGYARRSFIQIQDVCEAMLLLLKTGRHGDIFHLATAEVVSIRQLVSVICDKLGVRADNFIRESAARPGADSAYLLSTARAREQLGWQAALNLDRGLDLTIEWYLQNLARLSTLPDSYQHKE
jgi:dTDP-glucose 4,6-dehydratase